MYYYSVGYSSYEDSAYYKYSSDTKYSDEELSKVVENCIIDVLNGPAPKPYGWMSWPPNFDEVVVNHLFRAAMEAYGFTPLVYEASFSCMGWGSVSNPDDWGGSNGPIVLNIIDRIPKLNPNQPDSPYGNDDDTRTWEHE